MVEAPSLSLEDRIVPNSFISVRELPLHLSKLGLQCELVDDGQTIIINNGQMVVGFGESDPISTAIQLGFAFCNHLWPSALPNLLSKRSVALWSKEAQTSLVNKEWRQRKKGRFL